MSVKEQLDLLSQAAALAKEADASADLITQLEDMAAAMDIDSMTIDELE